VNPRVHIEYNGVRGYAIQGDTAVALISRVGSQTIYHALGARMFEAEHAAQVSTRIAFIRDPIERAKSAYRLFRLLQDNDMNYIPDKALKGFGAFCQYIVTEEDQHWTPQAEILRQYGSLCNVFYRFEDLLPKWYEHFNTLPAVMNESPVQYPVSLREAGLLEEFYAEDLRLRESLRG
jgi:hypothetical protein